MTILFNFLPIKKGGGQQVATSFIKVLYELDGETSDKVILVTADTFMDKLVTSIGYKNVIRIKNSFISRFMFEYFGLKKVIATYKVKGIFTMFGPDLRKVKLPSVVGCAYSNIFFPEVDFWKGWSIHKRVMFSLIDRFRLKRTLQADGIIFENEAMQRRVHQLYKYPLSKTVFIRPSVSPVHDIIKASDEFVKKTEDLFGKFTILILSGWHKNKNMDKVPDILHELALLGIKDVSFAITVSPEHPESQAMMSEAERNGTSHNIKLIGTVLPTDIKFLYEKIDIVLLLSLLESFSNNIIESWTYKRPLLISNLDWAKSICKEAAVYVDRDDVSAIARKIKDLKDNSELYNKMVESGTRELVTYPTPKQKVEQQLDFLTRIIDESRV